MIKNLVAFGCSWTYGSELADPLTQSYPALIAEHFGWDVEVQAEPNATLSQMLVAFTSWLTSHSPEEISETMLLVGLTDEHRGAPTSDDKWAEANYETSVRAFDHFATQFDAHVIQFNVITQNHKIKLPTLIDSSSALEMLVIRDKPRKDPLFAEHKHPNEKGQIIISEFLINKINSAIINE